MSPRSLVLLGWLHTLLGAGGLVGGGAVCWTRSQSPYELQVALAVFILSAVAVFLPSLLGGIGLLTNRPWGQPVVQCLSVLYLVLFPVGTALGAFGLWVLKTGRHVVPTPYTPIDLTQVRSCVHLYPVESALREAGLKVTPFRPLNLQVGCTIAPKRLRKQFKLPACVQYLETPEYERGTLMGTTALLYCHTCASGLYTLAPSEAPPGTPEFPPHEGRET